MTRHHPSCEGCGLPFDYVFESDKKPRKFCGWVCSRKFRYSIGVSPRVKIMNLRVEIDRLMEAYRYTEDPRYLEKADRCLKPLIQLTGWNDVI